MRIAVIGCGYLGAVHAAAMASLGHQVLGLDIDEGRIAELSQANAPFYEPGLDALLRQGLDQGRLSFSTDPAELADREVIFLAVGTPQLADGHGADLAHLDSAMEMLMTAAAPAAVLVGKSTVPVGTASRYLRMLEARRPDLCLMWNPEFLREGNAVADTVTPDRLVYGVAAGEAGQRAVAVLDAVYAPILSGAVPRIVTDLATAELTKQAANAFLATKISFINSMAELTEITGADITTLAEAIGLDDRIGPKFLRAGIGFGGGCLPKDIRALRARSEELGVGDAFGFIDHVDAVNQRARSRAVALTEEVLGQTQGARIAVLGLSFKADSDDVRDSPALEIAATLQQRGWDVTGYDPEARENALRLYPDLVVAASAEAALEAADAVLVLVEWREFLELDPEQLRDQVRALNVIDGRNCLDAARWRAAGWNYRALGVGR